MDELRADLMQQYGVCLDDAFCGRYAPDFVASLVVQMPEDCRWRVAENPDALWNMDRTLLALLVNQMQGYIWANADKKKRGPKPKPIGPRWLVESDNTRKLPAMPMSREMLLAELAKPRTGGDVDGGNGSR